MKILSEKIILKDKKIYNENNNNEYSEMICQMIINKIISKAISQINNDKIYSKLNEHCFDFIINSIEPFLSTNFIFYENSNKKNNNIKSNSLFYSIIPQNIINTWIEIKESNIPEFDRYHSDKIKIVKNIGNNNCIQKNNNTEKELNNIESKNIIENISDRNINRNDNQLNTLKEAIELDSHFNSNNDSNSETKIEEKKDKFILDCRDENNINNINNIDGQIERLRKKTKSLIIDLPYYDLPKEVYENKYITLNCNEENNLLRIEKEKEIMNKEQEKNLEKIKNKKDYFKNRLIREFDSNKITFDSNGCIINLNIPNIDSFSNDFYIQKPIINDLKLKNTSLYFNKENKNKNKVSKRMKLMKYLSANIPTINKKDIAVTENALNNKINNFEKKSSQKINFISKFKIMHPSYSLNSLINQNKKIKIDYNPINEQEKKKKLKIKIPPSGSNFDKIIPEVGVIIQNNTDNQTKKGGFEYYNKYNKPSLNEFKQLVDETLKLNNKIKTSHLSNNNKKQNIKSEKSFDYNGYNQEFFDNNNPLIQNPVVSISNLKLNDIKNKNSNKSLIKNKSHLGYNINSNYKVLFKSFDNKYNKFKNKNLFNKIILSQKNIFPNLYSILIKTNDEDDDNDTDKNENGKKNKNIFKSLKKRSFSNLYKLSENIIKSNNFFSLIPFKRKIKSPNKILSLPNIIETKKTNNINIEYGEEAIDNFNSKILKNKNWGDFIFSERNIKFGYESKNIFRKQYKLNDNKEIMEKRHRVPHPMVNNNSEKNQKI